MKALIIEDEAAAVRRMTKLIQEVDPNIEILTDLDSVADAVTWLENNPPPDVIFQDIHLADGSSFEIFNHVEVKSPIIFITAYDEYAIKAFKVSAIDYLLKPLKKGELEVALNKVRKAKGEGTTLDYAKLAKALQSGKYNKRFLIRFGQQIKVVSMKEAAYFYTQDKITFLVTHKGKRYPLDYSLEKIEDMMDKRAYFRINRQFIVNIEAIKDMYAFSKSRVKLTLTPPSELETVVSTERSPFFKKWLIGDVGTDGK